MKKIIALVLCLLLCLGLAQPALAQEGENEPHPPQQSSPGAFAQFYDEDSGHYVVGENAAITVTDSVFLNSAIVVVESGAEITVASGGRVELRGGQMTNHGQINVQADGRFEVRGATLVNQGTIIVDPDQGGEPPEPGRMEFWEDNGDVGKLENSGQFSVQGMVEFIGGELDNQEGGTVSIEGRVRFAQGAKIQNQGPEGSISGTEHGEIALDNPSEGGQMLDISGLEFYENHDAEDPISGEDLNGQFVYDEGSSRWIRGGQGHDPGDPGHGHGDNPGALEDFETAPGEYVITQHVTIAANDPVSLNSATVTVNSDAGITVEAEGRMELRGGYITNLGQIQVDAGGRLEARGAVLANEGTLLVRGSLEFCGSTLNNLQDGVVVTEDQSRLEFRGDQSKPSILENSGEITIAGEVRFAQGAEIHNSGSVTGDGWGRITLDNPPGAEPPLVIIGLSFFTDRGQEEIADPDGQFVYSTGKWVEHTDGFEDDPNDDPQAGTFHTITLVNPVNGTVTAEGLENGEVEVLHRGDLEFTITPDQGYKVSQASVAFDDGYVDDRSFNIRCGEQGTLVFLLDDVRSDLTLEIVFTLIDIGGLDEMDYVLLAEDALSEQSLKAAMISLLGDLGYAVTPDQISVDDIETGAIDTEGYGTFEFAVIFGEDTFSETGYLVKEMSDIIFRMTGDDCQVKIRVMDEEASRAGEFGVPAMRSGTMKILGYGNFIAAPMDPELEVRAADGEIMLPFNRGMFHLLSFSTDLNLYGFYVIQDDALCVKVTVPSGFSEQKTFAWDLNRYADLTDGPYTSQVFFGNDKFVLSLPTEGLGAANSIAIETGDSAGYRVGETAENTYLIEFLSDYYDSVTLTVTINGDVVRDLHLHRVGVHMEEYIGSEGGRSGVFHGTQNGSVIDYSDGNLYRVYGTYYIPDLETAAPYGLYVTYTYQDGTKSTRIITEPCLEPPTLGDDVSYENGVFIYPSVSQFSCCCDYLLYEAPDAADAPVQINVIVLKADPTESGEFGGVYFGSGAGVTWPRGS